MNEHEATEAIVQHLQAAIRSLEEAKAVAAQVTPVAPTIYKSWACGFEGQRLSLETIMLLFAERYGVFWLTDDRPTP